MAKKRRKISKKVSLQDIHKELQSIKRLQKKITGFEEQQAKSEKKIVAQESEELEALEDVEKQLKKSTF